MNFKDIVAGQIYEVGSETGYRRLAKVVETGAFRVARYHRGGYRGYKTDVKGAKVAYLDNDGQPRMTKIERVPHYGTTKVVTEFVNEVETVEREVKTETTYEDVEVSALEWVPSREVLRTVEDYRAIQKAKQAREDAKAAYQARLDDLVPVIAQKLEDAGLSTYKVSRYSGKVELDAVELMKLLTSEIAKAFAVDDAARRDTKPELLENLRGEK